MHESPGYKLIAVSRQNEIFRFFWLWRFSVLLFVPILGIVVWLPLCRRRSEEVTDKQATSLLDVEVGRAIS
jgi:hypothetical protein